MALSVRPSGKIKLEGGHVISAHAPFSKKNYGVTLFGLFLVGTCVSNLKSVARGMKVILKHNTWSCPLVWFTGPLHTDTQTQRHTSSRQEQSHGLGPRRASGVLPFSDHRPGTVCLLHFKRRTTPSARSSATWRRTCSVVSWNSELTPPTGAVVTSTVTWIWRRVQMFRLTYLLTYTHRTKTLGVWTMDYKAKRGGMDTLKSRGMTADRWPRFCCNDNAMIIATRKLINDYSLM